MNLLETIKASEELRALADAGHDAMVADAINATSQQPVPITAAMLAQAAPATMQAIASGSNPLAEMEVIASRLRAYDWPGVGAWADMLLMLGKMSEQEHGAVGALVAAAVPGETVTNEQVSAALNPIRPQVDGTIRAMPIDWSQVS